MSLLTDETRLHVTPDGYRYRLQFHLDENPSPPWEDEGAVPVLSYSGRGGFSKDGARGYDLLNPFPYLSDRAIRANLDDIAQLCGYSGKVAFDSDARLYTPDSPIADARRELIKERAGDWRDEGQKGLEALARFWTLAGVPAYVGESRGYCQGDWAAVLAVAHPEAVKAWGFKTMREYRKACPNDLQNAVNLWGAWCWGGVIGYDVARIDPAEWDEWAEANGGEAEGEDLNRFTDCTDVDSCWGFYPENDSDYFPLESNHAYALSEAIATAEADGERQAKLDAARREVEALAEAVAMMDSRPDMYAGVTA